MSFWATFLSHMRRFWAQAGPEILFLLQGQSSKAGNRKSEAGDQNSDLKLHFEELTLGRLSKIYLLEGRADLVVGGGLRSLERVES